MPIKYIVRASNAIIIWLCCSMAVSAQIDCKSNLGSHLKSIGESKFSWATEAMIAQGAMTERSFTNTMINSGLNWSSKNFKHQFYGEASFKYWINSNEGAVDGNSGSTEHFTSYPKKEKKHIAFKELFYQYGIEKQTLKLGVQTYVSPDYFLVDERFLAASYIHNLGQFTLNTMLGSSHQDISKMQNVCRTRHVYRLLREGRVDFVGNELFESNMFIAGLTYYPGKEKSTSKKEAAKDEFDEFESDEFSENMESNDPLIKEAGIAYYQEFGSVFHEYKHYGALYSAINLPLGIKLKLQGVYQYIKNDQVGLLYSNINRTFQLNQSSLSLNGGYMHKLESETPFYPTFSNMFIGEVIRLDSKEIPLAFANLKYAFLNKLKTYVKVGGAYQINGIRSNELDIEAGSKIWKGLRSYLTLSRIESDALDKTYYMGKMEIRIAL